MPHSGKQKNQSRHTMVMVSSIILCVAAYWLLDVVVDVFIFRETDILTSLLTPDRMCLVMRLINLPIILVFFVISQWMWFKHRQTLQTLKVSESELRAVFDNSATGITVSDLEGRIIQTNPAHQKMFGYSVADMQSMFFADFTHPDDVGKNREPYERLIAGEIDSFSIHKRFLHKDGRIIWAQVTISLVRDADNEPLRVIGMVQDISLRKQAELEKEQVIAELQQALKEIKTLQGIVPICSYCKQIRDDQGFWNRVESYLENHTGAQFSHGICPTCLAKHHPAV